MSLTKYDVDTPFRKLSQEEIINLDTVNLFILMFCFLVYIKRIILHVLQHVSVFAVFYWFNYLLARCVVDNT